jgi:hypothetical protein
MHILILRIRINNTDRRYYRRRYGDALLSNSGFWLFKYGTADNIVNIYVTISIFVFAHAVRYRTVSMILKPK